MLVGLGAVSTTFVAGVENVRRGTGLPIGSLSQMGTIRLGKRTEKRSPKIKEFVPLAELNDLVFAAWDPIPDDAYGAARKAGVLEPPHLEPIADFLKGLKPGEIEGTEEKPIKITFPSGATREFTGQSLLLTNSLPNFFFHCTAYDILRHCGIELGKRDFMGTPVSL